MNIQIEMDLSDLECFKFQNSKCGISWNIDSISQNKCCKSSKMQIEKKLNLDCIYIGVKKHKLHAHVTAITNVYHGAPSYIHSVLIPSIQNYEM